MRTHPTRLVTAGALLLLAAPLAACADETEAGRERLARARATWAAAGVTDYDLVVDGSCFCTSAGLVRIQVRAGTATVTGVELTNEAGGTTPPEGTPTTVEALFDVVARSLGTAEKVGVTYDGRGVPTTIDIDMILAAVDDEVTWTASVTPR
ncbi:DUF6174 domain-containing protein [Kineosporia sp. R_H_3]|uniref:DUF6174 domain-containing protein n=1 Tax=Kineosporia sp. R_H_3 TaxID=1961848 RepID=UPI000B4ADA55|nr:DUF6174 domain-containing protein [Kineosporia sp. R_H_3]